MSPAQKKVIDDHCTTEWAEKIASALGRLRASPAAPRWRPQPGHEVYKLTPEQMAAWRKAARAAEGASGPRREQVEATPTRCSDATAGRACEEAAARWPE